MLYLVIIILKYIRTKFQKFSFFFFFCAYRKDQNLDSSCVTYGTYSFILVSYMILTLLFISYSCYFFIYVTLSFICYLPITWRCPVGRILNLPSKSMYLPSSRFHVIFGVGRPVARQTILAFFSIFTAKFTGRWTMTGPAINQGRQIQKYIIAIL